jgi:hypothetical protein
MPHRVFQIELPLHPGWEAIGPLRASVLASVKALFPEPALAASIGLVAAELLENAVKFGRWEGGPAEGWFGLRVDGRDDRVEIEVSNPVAPAGEHVERLLAEIARIAAAPSPEQAYTKVVRGLAVGKPGPLGLARAAHEGGCALTAELHGNVVHVRAVTWRLAPAPPTPAAP